MIANIVVGIGFLGAGLIIKTNDHARGITTAALVWTTAAIGVLAGIGVNQFAITAAVIITLLLYVFRKLAVSEHTGMSDTTGQKRIPDVSRDFLFDKKISPRKRLIRTMIMSSRTCKESFTAIIVTKAVPGLDLCFLAGGASQHLIVGPAPRINPGAHDGIGMAKRYAHNDPILSQGELLSTYFEKNPTSIKTGGQLSCLP